MNVKLGERERKRERERERVRERERERERERVRQTDVPFITIGFHVNTSLRLRFANHHHIVTGTTCIHAKAKQHSIFTFLATMLFKL